MKFSRQGCKCLLCFFGQKCYFRAAEDFSNSPTVRDWAQFSRPISDWDASFNLRPQVYGWGALSCAPTVSCMWQCQLSLSIFILCLCLLSGPKPVVSKKLSNYCQVTHCSWCCDDYRALLCVHHILNAALLSATHAPLLLEINMNLQQIQGKK